MRGLQIILVLPLFGLYFFIVRPYDADVDLPVGVFGMLGAVPAAWLARGWLEANPTPAHVKRVTAFFHAGVWLLLGAALVGAVRYSRVNPIWQIPLPAWVGAVLIAGASILFCSATLTLILRGRGSPLAVHLTHWLAVGGLYSYTRNPIILSGVLLMCALGLWLQSLTLLLWTLLLYLPVTLVILSVYEERELEIRFGPAYCAYRDRTPLLLPRISPCEVIGRFLRRFRR